MENSKTKAIENKEPEINIETGDYFIPLEKTKTKHGFVAASGVCEIKGVSKGLNSKIFTIHFYNFESVIEDSFVVNVDFLILNTKVGYIQYDFTFNSKILYSIRKKIDRKSRLDDTINQKNDFYSDRFNLEKCEYLVPESIKDSINNQKTDFNDSIKNKKIEFIESKLKRKNLENLNDESYYGSYQKRQLLNVATQIYCSYLKTLPVVKNHNLIDISIEDAKLLIEKCNE